MTGKQVSAEQVAVATMFVAEPQQWFDGVAVSRKTELPGSTIRHFLFKFFKLGLLERVEVHNGYRYRLAPTAQTQPYFRRIQEAAAAMRDKNIG